MVHAVTRWLLFTLTGCAAMLHARGYDPTPDAPCGVSGIVCSGHYPTASCCPADYQCGTDPDAGFSTCPPGSCCSTLEPDPNPNSFGAQRRVRPQFQPDGGW